MEASNLLKKVAAADAMLDLESVVPDSLGASDPWEEEPAAAGGGALANAELALQVSPEVQCFLPGSCEGLGRAAARRNRSCRASFGPSGLSQAGK